MNLESTLRRRVRRKFSQTVRTMVLARGKQPKKELKETGRYVGKQATIQPCVRFVSERYVVRQRLMSNLAVKQVVSNHHNSYK